MDWVIGFLVAANLAFVFYLLRTNTACVRQVRREVDELQTLAAGALVELETAVVNASQYALRHRALCPTLADPGAGCTCGATDAGAALQHHATWILAGHPEDCNCEHCR